MKKPVLIIKHVEEEGPGMLGTFLEHAGCQLVTVELGRGESLPDIADDFSAVIALGGPMNVYEEDAYPFLKAEDLLIKEIVRHEVPFLGICLGAQLLAKACGAPVTKAAQKEIGWYNVELTTDAREDRLFRRVESPLIVFQWHQDTFDIPKEGVLLATSAPVRNQAFRMGTCAYGLQFHIEASPDMIEDWLKNERETDAEVILRTANKLNKILEDQAVELFNNFVRLIQSVARVKSVMKLFFQKKPDSRRTLWWDEKGRTLVATKCV